MGSFGLHARKLEKCMPEGEKMSEVRGKIAIVTGANSGMGMAAAEALSDKGATVIMLCRSEERGREAFARLTKDKDRKLDLMICDLGDYTSVRGFVRCVKEKYPRIDILVNNAGFISLDRQETKEGVERQFGINHLGHFLLTTELLDHMPAGARIVNVEGLFPEQAGQCSFYQRTRDAAAGQENYRELLPSGRGRNQYGRGQRNRLRKNDYGNAEAVFPDAGRGSEDCHISCHG